MPQRQLTEGKIKTVLLFSFIVLLPGKAATAQTQPYSWYGNQIYMASKAVEKYHYQPKPLDDALSEKLSKEFINTLDPSGLYFTKSDIAALRKWDHLLDDDIKSRSGNYLTEVSDLYRKRLTIADSIITAVTQNPFNFIEKDTLRFFGKKSETTFAVDDKALARRWKKWLKYQTLTQLYTPANKNEDPYKMASKDLLKKEADARAKVAARYKRVIKRIFEHPDGYDAHLSSQYINQFLGLFDPHTAFFSPSEKQEFLSSVSSSEHSFGISFNENDQGEIEVVNLTPGGSAWKSNLIHKGDVIVKIKPDQRELIDLSVLSPEDAMNELLSMTEDRAEFTLRKTNGQIMEVMLTKSKIRSDENVVKSYILNGEKKIGYISLPSFYTEWENNNPLGCANDVAKEIVKLQEENIEGLIIDLRYNGGGSVQEAMGLMGLFINEGPLCIFKVRNEKPISLKDPNRGTAYDGPLAVMVNGLSASASEIFSATMQDYNRAILVGSTTYGKSTGQIVIPIDTSYSLAEIFSGALNNKAGSYGYLKITTQGFYRVTNATHQKKGVLADVQLLEPYFYSEYRESASPYALSNDSISKKVVYMPSAPLPLKELKSKSESRVAANANFKRLTAINDSLSLMAEKESAVLLNLEFFKTNAQIIQKLQDEMEKHLYDSSKNFVVINNQYDKKVLGFDSFSGEINDRAVKSFQEDIYVEETYFILRDLLNFIKN